MKKITLWKRYADGQVRSLVINDTKEAVMQLLAAGFYLTEKEASQGQIDPPKRRGRTKKNTESEEAQTPDSEESAEQSEADNQEV